MQTKLIPAGARDFDQLPDCALIGTAAVVTLLAKSRTTIWRMTKDGTLPKSRKIGGSHNRWQVGEIRALLRGAE